MNKLGMALLCSAFQVTLLGSLAAVLYWRAWRRGPAAAARVAVLGLGVLVVLTLSALCPLPSWWSWAMFGSQSSATSESPPALGGNMLNVPGRATPSPSA